MKTTLTFDPPPAAISVKIGTEELLLISQGRGKLTMQGVTVVFEDGRLSIDGVSSFTHKIEGSTLHLTLTPSSAVEKLADTLNRPFATVGGLPMPGLQS